MWWMCLRGDWFYLFLPKNVKPIKAKMSSVLIKMSIIWWNGDNQPFSWTVADFLRRVREEAAVLLVCWRIFFGIFYSNIQTMNITPPPPLCPPPISGLWWCEVDLPRARRSSGSFAGSDLSAGRQLETNTQRVRISSSSRQTCVFSSALCISSYPPPTPRYSPVSLY